MDRLRALEAFKAEPDRGSFARAADVMNISCAAVTRAVRELEGPVGVGLVQRTTRQIALTSAGQPVLDRAAALLLQYEERASTASFSASDLSDEGRLAARHVNDAKLQAFGVGYAYSHSKRGRCTRRWRGSRTSRSQGSGAALNIPVGLMMPLRNDLPQFVGGFRLLF